MRLNPDCMRDVLLVVEDHLPLNDSLPMTDLISLLPNYSEDELTYTCLKLKEGGFLKIFDIPVNRGFIVNEIQQLTYEGHQFLENIRDQSTWNKVKQKLPLLGSSSVQAIMSVASQVILEKLKL